MLKSSYLYYNYEPKNRADSKPLRGSIWTFPGTPTKPKKYPPKQKTILYIIYKYTHPIYNIYKYITHNNIFNINIADK